mgnify:CR=1
MAELAYSRMKMSMADNDFKWLRRYGTQVMDHTDPLASAVAVIDEHGAIATVVGPEGRAGITSTAILLGAETPARLNARTRYDVVVLGATASTLNVVIFAAVDPMVAQILALVQEPGQFWI